MIERPNTLNTALNLAHIGLKVFPCHWPRGASCSCGASKCRSPAKHPLIKNWQVEASTDKATIGAWWQRWPDANIGIAAGQSGIFVLDVDPRHDGDATLRAFEENCGRLPPTWRFLTGGGGVHIVFRDPGLQLRNSAGQLGPGLDTRGRGGFIIGPGSLHMSGRRYAFDVDHHPDDVRLADVPTWLVDVLAQSAASAALAPEEWRAIVSGPIEKGTRNTTVTRVAGLLLRKGVDAWMTLSLCESLNRDHCRPPLDDGEISTIVTSIARREAARREE